VEKVRAGGEVVRKGEKSSGEWAKESNRKKKKILKNSKEVLSIVGQKRTPSKKASGATPLKKLQDDGGKIFEKRAKNRNTAPG